MTEKHYNPTEAHLAQVKHCEERKLPHFAPVGNCWRCGKNIYELKETEFKTWDGRTIIRQTGISVEQAGSELITGCPHCNRSFCD